MVPISFRLNSWTPASGAPSCLTLSAPPILTTTSCCTSLYHFPARQFFQRVQCEPASIWADRSVFLLLGPTFAIPLHSAASASQSPASKSESTASSSHPAASKPLPAAYMSASTCLWWGLGWLPVLSLQPAAISANWRRPKQTFPCRVTAIDVRSAQRLGLTLYPEWSSTAARKQHIRVCCPANVTHPQVQYGTRYLI